MLDARSPVSFADGVLDPGVTQELVDWLQHLQYRYYRITNKNEPEPFPIWHCELLGRDWPINQASDYSCTPQFLQDQTSVLSDVWRSCMRALQLPVMTQCHGVYANANTHGNEGNVHIDSQHPLDRTLLIYGVRQWQVGWGGETVFYDPECRLLGSVMPAPARVVFFAGHIRHGVNPISRACRDLRPVLVFKTRLQEPQKVLS